MVHLYSPVVLRALQCHEKLLLAAEGKRRTLPLFTDPNINHFLCAALVSKICIYQAWVECLMFYGAASIKIITQEAYALNAEITFQLCKQT